MQISFLAASCGNLAALSCSNLAAHYLRLVNSSLFVATLQLVHCFVFFLMDGVWN